MITGDAVLNTLHGTRAVLRQTVETFPGGHLMFVESRLLLLERCATDLQECHDAIKVHTFEPTEEMRATVVEIRNEVRKLIRVVDVSSAFVQGLAVFGGASTTYNAAGHIQRETVAAE